MTDLTVLMSQYKNWLRETKNKDEIYKWEATRTFQDEWNIDAPDFATMFKKSIAKAQNLLFQNSKGYIQQATRHKPEETRSLFRALFDESVDLGVRLATFSKGMEGLRDELETITGKSLSPQQDERTMSYYLAMRYPEKHYLYKDSYYRATCAALDKQIAPAGRKYIHFIETADRLKNDLIAGDQELIELHKTTLNPFCYSGDPLNLILQNFLYVTLQKLSKIEQPAIVPIASWWVYAPGLNASFWEDYADQGIIGLGWDYLGDLSSYPNHDAIVSKMREVGNKPDKSFKINSLACWDFANTIKPGDVIIPKRGLDEYLGYGIVESEYRYEKDRGEQPHIRNVRWLKRGSFIETEHNIVQKTLTNITNYPDYVKRLRSLIIDEVQSPAGVVPKPVHHPKNYILYGPPGTGKTWRTTEAALSLIEGRNIDDSTSESREAITGRYAAAREEGFIEFVTFHQSYSYEEFIEGIRPQAVDSGLAFNVEAGVFKVLCDNARKRPDQNHVLIIDEISRGNVARIFGELITLIEDDKRSGMPNMVDTRLPYSRARFSVPANLFIIGTMNTADRSVEALDTALRRRFSFVEIAPKPNLLSDEAFALENIDLAALLATINRRLVRLLDHDHQIGHAYFMGMQNMGEELEALRFVFRDRILPQLKEYFYNDAAKVGLVLGEAFVKRVTEEFAFALFDEDAASRFQDRAEYVFEDVRTLILEDFKAIYERAED